MSYSYTARQPNPYVNTGYSNTKVPQTLLNPSPTPQKHTLQRNQSFQNRHYNQDLIQLIAKIRSLQDDLINERFKNQSLQRKLSQAQKIIDNLQYQLNAQSYQLQKYMHEIELSNEKNIQILKYQQNLKIVGEQIEELNNALTTRNRDNDSLYNRMKQLEFQINKAHEDNHVMKISNSMWKKEVDAIVEEFQGYTNSMKDHQSTSYNKVIQQLNNLPQSNFSPNRQGTYSPNRQAIYQPNRQNSFSASKQQPSYYYPNQQSLTFNMTTTSEDMTRKIQQLRTILMSLVNDKKSLERQSEISKKEMSSQLIKQREKFIKLEYQHKLLEERSKDGNKKQDLIANHYNQQKLEEIIEQLMQKEDDYVKMIEQLNIENTQLKQDITAMEENHQYLQKVDSQEKQSIIDNLRKENHILQSTINELSQKINAIESHYQQVIAEKQQEMQVSMENNTRLGKRNRKMEEESYQHQIKIQQLSGENNMLKKELAILQGDLQPEEQEEEE